MSVGRLRHRVGAAIARGGLWRPGDRVGVAVSGGLDSIVLLDLLVALRGWHGGELRVATIDHGLHAESADHAQFVEDVAQGLGLPCTTVRLSLPSRSEDAARAARYAALGSLPVDVVALGHHADDLAETVLLHLLRGTGTTGLAGMRPVASVPCGPAAVPIVRPLLDLHRADLVAWAAHRRLAWREDPTNADPRYLRNRVRHEVMPLLEAIRPGAARALARSARNAATDDAFLDAQIVAGPPWDVAFVASGPEAVVRRSLVRGLPGIGARTVDDAVRLARRGHGRIEIAGGILEIDGGEVRVVARPDESTEE